MAALNYYPQNYGQVPYMVQPQPRQEIGIKGRPVSSIDEVRATSIDFDGSIFFFPDLANKKIYTKQINMDGTSTLNVYELTSPPVEQATVLNSSMYITREEFDKAIQELNNKMAPPIVKQETPKVDMKF